MVSFFRTFGLPDFPTKKEKPPDSSEGLEEIRLLSNSSTGKVKWHKVFDLTTRCKAMAVPQLKQYYFMGNFAHALPSGMCGIRLFKD